MIKDVPTFTFKARYSLSQWYGHVQLLPDHILGQWFCLDRRSGRLLWERRYLRPNNVVGISDGVIIADEMRSDGPWTFGFGCYGLSLETGELLWTSHRNGIYGKFVRGLDFIPGFTNDLRDGPVHVAVEECVCASGRVLNVHNGRQVRRITHEQVRAFAKHDTKSDARTLYDGSMAKVSTRVQVADGRWLSHKRPGEEVSRGFHLYLMTNEDSILWHFDLASTGYHISHLNYYAYRYVAPHVYVVASEDASVIPHPTKDHYVVPNPTIFHLLTLDLVHGQIVQDIRLHDQKVRECRIEDTDDHGIAISAEGRNLMYYERALLKQENSQSEQR